MEVKPGYKQTEAGVIPEDWDGPLLGELLTFKNGLNKAKEFFGYGTPIVNYMDVYGKRGLFAHDLQGRVSLSKQELKTFEVRKGDVFFTRTSETAEEVGMTSVMLDVPEDTVFSGFVLRARPKDDSLDDQFKKYCFSTSFVRKQITSQSTETTRALTNGRCLSAVAIARPAKPEQRAIAGALSDVDALLGALDQLIAKKRDLKQAAMQKLLTGQTRLPGFTGKWEVKRLGDLCTMKSGEGITAKNIDDVSPFPCYGGNGLRGFTTRFTHEGNYCLIGRVGALCGNLLEVTGQFFASEHAIVVTAFENVDVGWLTLALGTLKLNRRAESSAQPVLTVSKLRPLEVIAPATKAEQTAIAEVLTDMDAELAALEQRRAKTRALKQGMMQELLTGRTRLI
jgi:type I restriction enzyme S subunit